jgi:hypothetical protein
MFISNLMTSFQLLTKPAFEEHASTGLATNTLLLTLFPSEPSQQLLRFIMTRKTRRGAITASIVAFVLMLLWSWHRPVFSLSSLMILNPEFHPHYPKPSDMVTERLSFTSLTGQNHHANPTRISAVSELSYSSDEMASYMFDSVDTPASSAQYYSPPPLITFIVLWSPDDRSANYLPNFFASAGANPDIEILLLKFDKYGKGNAACELERAANVPNVREVCVPMDEYYDLHASYMCSVWNCSPDQSKEARKVIEERFKKGDRVRTLMLNWFLSPTN